MSTRNIVTLSAGLRQPSSTRLLADRLGRATLDGLEAQDVTGTVETIELREFAHDIVDAMLSGFPSEGLDEALGKVTGADGLIVATPLFTTTFSGLFKSFVDILDTESLTGMPVLLGATGGTPRHSLALEYSVRPLFTYLHADVARTSVFAATDDWAGDGDQVNPLPQRIERAGREFAGLVANREKTGVPDLYEAVPSFDEMLKAL